MALVLALIAGLAVPAAPPRAALAAPATGTVVAWGDDSVGKTAVPPGLTDVIAITAGYEHSLALKADGTVVAWGSNIEGQTTIPDGLSDVTAIAAAGYHSLALRADGTVVAWGVNGVGESTVPDGLSDVIAIAAGNYHSLALKADGTVVAWGNHAGTASDVKAIAGGGNHSLALKTDGTVVAWGLNDFGQTTIPDGLHDVTAVAAGDGHSLALKADGTVVAWGWDNRGQATVPDGLSDVTAIAASGLASLALKADGTVVAWGDNWAGHGTVPAGLANVIAIAAGYHHNLALVAAPVPAETVLFEDAFAPGWGERWSWGASLAPVAAPSYSGSTSYSVRYTSAWGGFRMMPTAGSADWSGYDTLRFAIYGGRFGGQRVKASIVTASGQSFDLGAITVPANRWAPVALPLPNHPALAAVTELVWQEWRGAPQRPLYLDQIVLSGHAPPPPAGALTLYDDALAAGWHTGWSWDIELNPAVTAPRYSGAVAAEVRYSKPWGAYRLVSAAGPIDSRPYTALRFALHGGEEGGQVVKVWLLTAAGAYHELAVITAPAGRWSLVALPMPAGLSNVTELVWQQHTGQAEPPLYLDRIELLQ